MVEAITIDTRTAVLNNNTLFIAISGVHFNAHAFISTAYEKGIRMFIVEDDSFIKQFQNVSYILVGNSILALQQIAKQYRETYTIPIIGVTGSNGKTIVKEWLFQLLNRLEKIAVSPRSYNSQIGVPLSIFQLEDYHTLGIFEAGISQSGEMNNIFSIIQPTIGILTNIGSAHNAGFSSLQEKFDEKMKLFENADIVISSTKLVNTYSKDCKFFFTWGEEDNADIKIISIDSSNVETIVLLEYRTEQYTFKIPFVDEASVENVMNCICLYFYLNYPIGNLQKDILQLRSIPMRMALKKLGNDAILIDDTYSADTGSLKIALDYLENLDPSAYKTLVISDFVQTGVSSQEWLKMIFETISFFHINRIIGIGKEWYLNKDLLPSNKVDNIIVFEEVNEVVSFLKDSIQSNEIILLKGARNYSLDKIVKALEFQSHDTRIEVILPHLIDNIKYFKKHLHVGVKIMGMVKAFSYGTGSYEIAKTLIKEGINYLAVAYLDEGVELRKKGIDIPIMVMNVELHSLERLVEYRLEPVIYSVNVWNKIIEYLIELNIKDYPIHIELETGMNRLGLNDHDVIELGNRFNNKSVKIQSVFSHLAASEDEKHDEFSLQQYVIFNKIEGLIAQVVKYRYLKHILNSNGILRHPSLQMDMVRLGIGMYGLASFPPFSTELKTVVNFITTIAQIKHLEEGATISYGRKGLVSNKMKIATLRVGYADGYPRSLGNGIGKVYINGHYAAIIGTICMDMLMIDVTEIPNVKEGDIVELWGENISLNDISKLCDTIPYEILTGVNNRVKRVYITG